jgi:hypothetical protein
MDATRVVSRRVIKAIPMIEEWRQYLNELAKRIPIDSAKFFEFKSTLAIQRTRRTWSVKQYNPAIDAR